MNSMGKILAAQIVAGIVVADILSALFLRERLRFSYPYYLNIDGVEVARGYPQYYFASKSDRGFDIDSSRPKGRMIHGLAENGAYPVWSNTLGCFDREYDKKQVYELYLAGDSFTWGYTNYEKKFGTILETKLRRPVLKCGVSHTGQKHQFLKFKEIAARLGYYPKTAIVSIVPNDIRNDFLFPQATVYKGYLVDNYRAKKTQYGMKAEVVSPSEVRSRFENWQRRQNSISGLRKIDPRNISGTAILTLQILNGLGSYARKISGRSEPNINEPCFEYSYFSKASNCSGPNKEILIDWTRDARKNGYRIVFVGIASKESDSSTYSSLREFLRGIGAEFFDFSDYIRENGLKKEKLYWRNDGHFNVQGNIHYAEF